MEKTYGKTIKIFLIDGSPNGRMSCELSNWIGKAYKIPRKLLKKCNNRKEILTTGIYLLLGINDESPNEKMAYIGESDLILKRLKQHQDKEFWNEAIVIISKDKNLNKAHVKYLENKLYNIAIKAGRYKLYNENNPKGVSISEADTAEMEEFADNIRLLVNALGYKIFEDLKQLKDKKNNTFYIKAARGAEAKGQMTTEGFVVFKNSQIATKPVATFPESYHKLRQELIDKKIIIEKNENLFMSKDYLFSSPSAAAMIVMARTANGLLEWKLEDGTCLKEHESAK